jgi:hypothetical protein
MKTKVINLFGGPGTGKSTTAAGLFHQLKLMNVNCEYVQEYAKDKAWEHGNTFSETPKVFQAQEYIFGKQHFRMRRCSQDVELIITDSPLFLGLIYMPEDFPIPSIRPAIREAYDLYDNLNVFLKREKVYNPKGRLQTEDKAKDLDLQIKGMLDLQGVEYDSTPANEHAVETIINTMIRIKWGDLLPKK